MSKKQSETNELTDRIIRHLFSKGCFAWREDSNPVPVLRNGVLAGFRPPRKTGKPDIVGILPPVGRFIGVEIKTGEDKIRPEQAGFHHTATLMGAFVITVKTWDDYLEKISTVFPDGV